MEYCCSHDLQWCPGYKAWRTQKEAWCCQHKSLLCPQESGSAKGVVRKFSQRLSGTAAASGAAAGHGHQPLATRLPVLASLLALAAVTGALAAAATRCGRTAAARRMKASRTLIEEQAADSFPESPSPELPLLEPERFAGAATPGDGSPAAALEMEALESRH